MSPFQALYRHIPPTIATYTSSSTYIMFEIDHLLHSLKINLLQAQNRMRQVAIKKRRDLELKPGEMVLVKLQPHMQTLVAGRQFAKLAKRYYGFFPIIEWIKKVVYRLQLPEGSKIHPVFHIPLLKPFRSGEDSAINTPLQLLKENQDSRPAPRPEAICAMRNIL